MKKPSLLRLILDAKNEIYQKKVDILKDENDGTLIILSLNIPGWPKKNKKIKSFLKRILIIIKKNLVINIIYFISTSAGYYYFLKTKNEATYAKKECVALEEKYKEFRLVDLDCIDLKTKMTINRYSLGLKARKCFLCNNAAHDCIIAKNHSISDLIGVSYSYIDNFLQRII